MAYLALLLFPLFVFGVPFPEHVHNRRAFPPFISGDGFRVFADFVFDEHQNTIVPKEVFEGSVIFVKTDYTGHFFQYFHPQIQHRYILITHNSDYGAPRSWGEYLEDPKLIAWFAMNIEWANHPKLHPIPIGIANYEWPHGKAELIEWTKVGPKTHLLYYNLTVSNYFLERADVWRLFSSAPFCYSSQGKNFAAYLRDLADSKFVLSPRGNGIDTHRLWESLYLCPYPIVKRSTVDAVYEGLPVVLIDHWESVTEEFLNQKYEELSKKTFSLEPLRLDYWTHLIDSYRTK